ncbi:ribbon-helix-helix domain-containing protein [Patulibacter sp. S7RM1-6]
MRTTITLDDDVAARLRELQRERGASFKDVVNDALRRGIAPATTDEPPYRMPTARMGLRPGFDVDRAREAIDRIEDEGRGAAGRPLR